MKKLKFLVFLAIQWLGALALWVVPVTIYWASKGFAACFVVDPAGTILLLPIYLLLASMWSVGVVIAALWKYADFKKLDRFWWWTVLGAWGPGLFLPLVCLISLVLYIVGTCGALVVAAQE